MVKCSFSDSFSFSRIDSLNEKPLSIYQRRRKRLRLWASAPEQAVQAHSTANTRALETGKSLNSDEIQIEAEYKRRCTTNVTGT